MPRLSVSAKFSQGAEDAALVIGGKTKVVLRKLPFQVFNLVDVPTLAS